MNSDRPSPALRTDGRMLVFEREGVTADRVRQMLASDSMTCCVVDDLLLFHELRGRLSWAGFVVGIERLDELAELKLGPDVAPLILLVPASGGQVRAHYRVAVPHALLVERRLSHPDALRVALGPEPTRGSETGPTDPVRQAFEPFGLSERQLEVLRRALLGDSSPQIGARLFISEPTVRNHLHAIYERLEVSGRRELMGRFVRSLLDADDPA